MLNNTTPSIIVNDVDDTLANPSPYRRIRGTFEQQLRLASTQSFTRELLDTPVAPWVHEPLHVYYRCNATRVIAITGRQLFHHHVTLAWLRLHHIRCDALYHVPYGSDGHLGYVSRKYAAILNHCRGFGVIRVYDDQFHVLDKLPAWFKTFHVVEGMIAEAIA